MCCDCLNNYVGNFHLKQPAASSTTEDSRHPITLLNKHLTLSLVLQTWGKRSCRWSHEVVAIRLCWKEKRHCPGLSPSISRSSPPVSCFIVCPSAYGRFYLSGVRAFIFPITFNLIIGWEVWDYWFCMTFLSVSQQGSCQVLSKTSS